MTSEKRYAKGNIQVRERPDETEKIIEGYFAVFNDETEIFDNYYEKIAPSAFDNIKGKDIKGLINHDSNFVLGRTTNNTLELSVDNKGLYGKIYINENDTEAMNLYHRVQRGDVNQCSFGFFINKETTEWIDDKLHSTLEDVELLEVSVVTFPAYSNTLVSARDKVKNKKLNIKKKILKEKFINEFKNNDE